MEAVTITGHGGNYANVIAVVAVTVTDNDEIGTTLEANPAAVTVAEGESQVLDVSLVQTPTGAVTVTITGHGGTDVALDRTSLTFTDENWQQVTVTAAEDSDLVDDAVTLTLLANGGNYANVTAEVAVTVKDNDGVGTAEEEGRELPADLSLHGNYPNPFRTATRIVFDLPEQAQMHVEVSDILGRLVYTSPVRRVDAGWDHTLSLDLSATTSGLYIYRVFAETASGTLVRTGRMLQVR